MRKAVVLMALTFLFYAGVATAFSTADFVKIDVDGQTFYTQPELQNSDFIIASDRIFYGSDIGRVDINFLVKTRVDNQTFSWGIETRGKEIEVQTVKEGRSQKMGEIFIDSKKPILKEEWESFSATLFFNPQEIGLAEEFDIILYDDTGKEVARLDPVLSGFSFYQEITLATATFGLSANVTNDHTVPIFINPTDTNFWSNETWHDGNGIQFTDVNGVQDYNFAWEDFNATSKLAVAHLDINDTFTKDTNVIVRMYFKGANTSYTDAAPYPSTYLAAYYFNESSGNLVDRTARKSVV